jgi:tellurite resistance protein TerC
MNVSLMVWILTCVVILGLFVFDFFAHVRVPHDPTFKESAIWSSVYIALAVVFGFFIWWQWGGQFGGEYFAGYITEKALSVDNLFVFTVIMTSFAVPRPYQQKLLLIGIVMALVMRAGFIAVGAAAINTFSWVFYLFGLVLILTAVKLARESGHQVEAEVERENRLVTLVRRFVPTTETYDGDRFITRIDGKLAVTPLMLALVAIGFTDLLFALDSIPAIYGLTEEPYIVFTANAFALMGLRQLFFLIGGLLDRLVYLSVGLFVMFAPIVWLVMSSLKTESALSQFPPTFLPYSQKTVQVAGFDKPLPLFMTRDDKGELRPMAQVRRIGIMATMVDPVRPDAPIQVNINDRKPVNELKFAFGNYTELFGKFSFLSRKISIYSINKNEKPDIKMRLMQI